MDGVKEVRQLDDTAYQPQGTTENIGDALGLLSSRVEKSVKQLK